MFKRVCSEQGQVWKYVWTKGQRHLSEVFFDPASRDGLGLMRRFSAAWLLGSRVRIPPGAWIFVLCVLFSKGRMQKPGPSRHRKKYEERTWEEKKTRWGRECVCVLCRWVLPGICVSVCRLETWRMRQLNPELGCLRHRKKCAIPCALKENVIYS